MCLPSWKGQGCGFLGEDMDFAETLFFCLTILLWEEISVDVWRPQLTTRLLYSLTPLLCLLWFPNQHSCQSREPSAMNLGLLVLIYNLCVRGKWPDMRQNDLPTPKTRQLVQIVNATQNLHLIFNEQKFKAGWVTTVINFRVVTAKVKLPDWNPLGRKQGDQRWLGKLHLHWSPGHKTCCELCFRQKQDIKTSWCKFRCIYFNF